MQVPHNSVVVVADGRKMLFLRNEGDNEFPNLIVESAQEQDNPATRDQATDAAGGASSTQGAARSSFEPTDFHQLEEDRWAKSSAEAVNKRALTNDFDALAIIAPPKTLGELRKQLHKEASRRVVCEIPKEMTGHTIADIEALLVSTTKAEEPAAV